MTTKPEIYDIGIIGTGAAGLTASIFASRYELTNITFGQLYGGEIANASIIENYPGFKSITGSELTAKIIEQVKVLGGEMRADKILKILKRDDGFHLVTEGEDKIPVRSVIISTGTRRRKLNVPGEEKLAGRGVSYCATCDAAFFKGKMTAVVGGGDAAMTAALHVAQFSPTVYLLVRGHELGGEPIWRRQVRAHPGIKILYQTEISEVVGESKVSGVKLTRPYEGLDRLPLEGVFVEVGADPDTAVAIGLGVKTDPEGYIQVSENMETNLAGVFAAGDVTSGNAHLDQIISAAAEGGLAARSAFRLLTNEAMEHSKSSFFRRILGR